MRESGKKKEFRIPSVFSEVQKTSAKVLRFLKPLDLDETACFDMRLCLEEALINAMKYGHKMQKSLKVRLVVEYDTQKVSFLIEDQGQGFKPENIKDCTKEDNLLNSRGRGVYLIRQLMDKVSYNAEGSALHMVKFLKTNRRSHGS